MQKDNPKETIKTLIAKGRLDQALEILLKRFEESSDLIRLSSQFKSLENDRRANILTSEDYARQRNQITVTVLTLMDELKFVEAKPSTRPEPKVKAKKKRVRSPRERALTEINSIRKKEAEILDLSGLGLTEVPEELSDLDHLVYLNLGANKIKEIQYLDQLVNLQELSLADNRIDQIDGLERLENLVSLDLSKNDLREIQEFSGLEQLKRLDLQGNGIKEIKNLHSLVNLEELLLSNNPIAKIENLERLERLTYLALDNCSIEEIEQLESLPNLNMLYLRYNQIKRVDSVAKLKEIKILDLGHNAIEEVNDLKKTDLKHLEELHLNDNNLSVGALAENKSFFDFLKSREEGFKLYINDNPFLDELPSLNKSDYLIDANHYKTFLKDEPIITYKEETVEITLPHKLVILGNSNAGKSSLVDFLRTGKLQDDSVNKQSTEVLDIVQWKPEDQPEFLIYDFGGQDYYHATYQMFFSEDASYILLWSKDSNHNYFNREKTDLRPEEYYCFDVNYWLGNIQYLNETINFNRSKDQEEKGWYKNLLLVENKIDVEFEEPKPLKTDERFGEIEQFKISLWEPADLPIYSTRRHWLKDYLQSLHHATSEETQERKEAIQDYLGEWPELKNEKNEWRFEELKVHLQKKFASWEKMDDEDVSRILNRFSVSGLIIWYRYVDLLKDRIWVDPNQLQAPILELLNHEDLKHYHGKIPLAAFNQLPEFERYRDLLMQKQIITYDQHEQIYIIPQKLQLNPENDPLYRIATLGLACSFTIKFKNFMPLGIMNRLIRMFGSISDKKYYSRYEMVFSLDPEKVGGRMGDEKVLLQCDMESLTLTICSTNDSEDLWTEIFVRILLAYHRKEESPNESARSIDPEQRMKGQKLSGNKFNIDSSMLDFDELVPNDLQISLDDQYFVDYSEIKKAVQLNLKKVQVYSADDDIKEVRVYRYNPFFSKEIKRPKKVFISYSHDDLEYRRELQKYLINMERENLIEVWQDGMIQPGSEWDLTIKENLENADVIILLVSQSFIASNYIHEVELRKTIEKQLDGTAQFFPILIKNCDYQSWKALPKEVIEDLKTNGVPLSKFQFIPQSQDEQRLKPINAWEHPEDAWVSINSAIREYVTS